MEHQDWETHIVHCKMGNATNVKKQNNSKKKRHNYNSILLINIYIL